MNLLLSSWTCSCTGRPGWLDVGEGVGRVEEVEDKMDVCLEEN